MLLLLLLVLLSGAEDDDEGTPVAADDVEAVGSEIDFII